MSTEKTEKYSAEWWVNVLLKASKQFDDDWRTSAKRVVDRYLDDRRDSMSANDQRKYNIFWANTQILKSALYATPPKPEVRRQHADSNDDIARTAALILQRILTFGLNADNSEEHEAFQLGVEDRLIPGAGQVWVNYEPEFEKQTIPAVIDPMTGLEIEPAREIEIIVSEEAEIEYVQWQDFMWSPARVWREVWWVSKRAWMTEESLEKRFGKDKVKELKVNAESSKTNDGFMKGFQDGKFEIYEIWCKSCKKAFWVHIGSKTMLDQRDDPLKLDDFFPCPRPLLATHTTNSTLPRPDYILVQDQYEELDTLNDRINTLTKALRVVGAYDSGTPELRDILSGNELRMIPVANWDAFVEKKGIQGSVDWFPVDQIAEVLRGLIEQRREVVQQIYELTSISDIMRGVSQARETAKAQTLKAQYSSVRLQLSQQKVSAWVTGALRIKCEVICRHFQPQSIIEQSQIMVTESAQFAEQAVQLLKDYRAASYRILISEESLGLSDYTAERENRINFLTSIGQFLSQAGQVTEARPEAMPFLLRMISWVASSFRGADDVEAILDQAVQLASQPAPPEPQEPPPPSPEQIEQARAQADIQVDNAKTQNARALQEQKDRNKIRQIAIQNLTRQRPDANL